MSTVPLFVRVVAVVDLCVDLLLVGYMEPPVSVVAAVFVVPSGWIVGDWLGGLWHRRHGR